MISFSWVSMTVHPPRMASWGLITLLLLGGMGCTINLDLGGNSPVSVSPAEETTRNNGTPGITPQGETSSRPSGNPSVAEVANLPDDNPQLVDGGPMISISTRYQNQPFSRELYQQIPWWGEACTVYPVKEVVGSNICNYSRDYEFADGLLLMAGYGTEGVTATFRPHQPMTLEAAKNLGWILARGEINENQMTEQKENQIVYSDLSPLTEAGPMLVFDLEGGQVVKIIFGVSTP
ncbi:hypothetical protein [Spirulina subsalsa]|uniref:hypothetical protein n=1 Tax=Spirulina subsalsa TaxID=54311 RepID=UPI0002F2275A|nr:hypothetical protein [Spirulina subsalsa]